MRRNYIPIGIIIILILSFVMIPVTTAQDGGEETQYIVKEGDNLYIISLQFGVSIDAIVAANNLGDPRLIYPGQLLIIPAPGTVAPPATATVDPTTPPPSETPPPTTETPDEDVEIYIVQPGDNLFRIAERFGTTVQVILELNPEITTPSVIYAGQEIRLVPSDGSEEVTETPTEAAPTETPTVEATEETPTSTPTPTEAVEVTEAATEATPDETQTPATEEPVVFVPTAEFGFGYGVELAVPGLNAEAVSGRLQELGVEWAKHSINWADYEPVQGQIDFTELDNIVTTLESAGVNILLSVSGAPAWARVGMDGVFGPPSDSQQYANFVGALASRYGSRVAAYEIWDQPNLQDRWGGKAVSGASYVELLSAAYAAIKAANPAAVVVSAGLAPTGGGPGAINDRDFLRQMYVSGLSDVSDAIGAHPYGWANSPDSTCCETNPDVSSFDDHPSFFFLETLEAYRAIMIEFSDAATFIWVTEFGWGSIENFPIDVLPGFSFVDDVTLDEQSQYTERAFNIADNIEGEYIGPMFAWNMNFCQTAGLQAYECYWSMLDPGGNPRPVFNAFANITK